jgi:hypothetical protein
MNLDNILVLSSHEIMSSVTDLRMSLMRLPKKY